MVHGIVMKEVVRPSKEHYMLINMLTHESHVHTWEKVCQREMALRSTNYEDCHETTTNSSRKKAENAKLV